MDPESISLILNQKRLKSIIKKGSKVSGLLFLLFGLMITGVSAYFYQHTTMTVTQKNAEIATITIKNFDLGNIKEGETRTYTSSEVANLGEAIKITTTTEPVYLHLDSNLDTLGSLFSTYKISVLYKTVPPDGTYSGTASLITLSSPEPPYIVLNVTGTWVFDLSVEITANSVDSNTPTTVTIIASAESTNLVI
jgi:hypothetical protein